MFDTLDATVPHLPGDRPHYLMGVGKPDDIVGAVLRGIDMFDCVLPTRSGRNGQAFTGEGPLNIKNARFSEDASPLEEDCPCPACRQFSRAYLHHTFKSGEIIAAMLLTWHNLTFYQNLMAALRAAIVESRLPAFAAAFRARYGRAMAAPG
jgi:queuine tRNA-ribosyltransferase